MNDARIKPSTAEPAIRVVMMPRDMNAAQTIFGGVLLSYIDQAGFVEARRQSPRRYVTVSMQQVEFHQPVFVGDIVSFRCTTERIGRTSITVRVSVMAQRFEGGQDIHVTDAVVVFVAIDDECNPISILDDA